jgi:uncharacterized protein (DUF362 family)
MPAKSSRLHHSKYLSRRDFLRLAAAGLGGLAAGPLLSACGQATTATEVPTATSAPTLAPTLTVPPTPSAAATLAAGARPEIIKFFPTVPSTVVQTHHSGVWDGKALVPGALRQLLNASITKLTGLNDAREAWAALFKPGERIAIKVNTFSNSLIWTHMPLVKEVTDCLQEAGIPAEQITIFDAQAFELTTAGYTINLDGPGIRCTHVYGNSSKQDSEVLGKKINLANVLKDCHALINMPVLKSHMLAGITFAMKNHYGSFPSPSTLHSNDMREIAALNALPEIKDRTRLIIGDALAANLRYTNSWPYWREDWIGDSIFMSYDPVATDTQGLLLLTTELQKDGGNAAALTGMATPALEYAVELGLGTNDTADMDVIEQTIA